MALKVGITGGIGSGKTTACQIFERLGIPVYYADAAAKRLMVEQNDLVKAIKQLFGSEAYYSDGSLNRLHIASIAFEDKSKLEQLNQLVHPAVARDSLIWHQNQEGVPYTLKEAALLFESGSYKALDYVIVVTAPETLRIQRVVERDQTTEAAVKARIKQQMPESEKVAMADFVIQNDSTQLLVPQIIGIHQELLKKSGRTHDEI